MKNRHILENSDMVCLVCEWPPDGNVGMGGQRQPSRFTAEPFLLALKWCLASTSSIYFSRCCQKKSIEMRGTLAGLPRGWPIVGVNVTKMDGEDINDLATQA